MEGKMIYAELKNIKTYKGINKNLDKAIDFIAEKKYLNASFGKNIIEGDTIYKSGNGAWRSLVARLVRD